MRHKRLFVYNVRTDVLQGLASVLLVLFVLAQPLSAFAQADASNTTSTPPETSSQAPADTNQVNLELPADTTSDSPKTQPSENIDQSDEEEGIQLGDGGEQMSSMAAGLTSDLPPVGVPKDDEQYNAARPDFYAGAFTYQYKLKLPPGRNGLTPDISLIYNNQTADEINSFGYGWDINIPYIERINRTGSDNLYNETYFTSSFDGELATTTNASTTAYAAKVDNGTFRTYTFVSNTWLVVDKSGTQYKFGYATTSQMNDPNNSSNVYRWMLQEVRDKNGNYITYSYYKEKGNIYPSAIKYTGNGVTDGPFEVDFSRTDKSTDGYASSTRPAFGVLSKYVISQVQVKMNGSVVRQYDLAYTTGDNNYRWLLQSITESDWDEQGTQLTYPATTFTYTSTGPDDLVTGVYSRWDTRYQVNDKLPVYFSKGNITGVDQGLRMADVNGDGLPDFVWSQLEGTASSTSRVYINDGSNNWNYDSSWSVPIQFVKDGADMGVRLADVNGDLLPDILWAYDDGTGSTTEKTYINTGSGWTENSTWAPPEYFIIGTKDNGVRLLDVNGDGLTDIVYDNSTSTTVYNKIYINNGAGWTLNTNWQFPTAIVTNGVDDGVRFADINNDGLVDFIRGYQATGSSTGTTFINNGKGWNIASYYATLPMPFVDYTDGSNVDRGVRFGDVNGDGLVDFCVYAMIGGTFQNRTWINTGKGWVEDYYWHEASIHVGPHQLDEGTRLADINGDGMPDLVQSWYQSSTSTVNRYLLNISSKTDLLSSIKNEKGGIVNVTYKQTPLYHSASSKVINPQLPLVLDTVSNITKLNGVNNVESTDYSYAGGLYYFNGGYDRKLAGFASTTETNGLGYKTKTYYAQGSSTDYSIGNYSDSESKIGKPYRVEVTDASDNIYHKTINKWENAPLNYGRNFVKLTQAIDWSQDGNGDSKQKVTTFAYDDSTGNLSQKINWGEATATDSGTYSDVGSDKFITNYEYATSTGGDVNLPSHETTKDQSGTKVKEAKYYYDTLSLGSADTGNQTKVERWVTGSTYVNSQKTYNSYGLVTQDTDPRSKNTTYTYDTYNLYPATTTNPLSQTTVTQYDYTSGKIATTTDANNLVFATFYDAFDRPKEMKQPATSTLSTLETKTLFTYTDGSVPTVVKRIDYLNNASSVDSYAYNDGFGRTLETRTKAEGTSDYIVKNFTFGPNGLLSKETLPRFGSGSTRTGTTSNTQLDISYTYDPLNRVTNITNNVGSTTNTYNDWALTITNPLGKQKILTKDAYDNLIQVDEKNGGSTYTTAYTYDGLGDLTNITDALGNVRNFTYDGLGRRLTAQDLHDPADATYGSWSYSYDDSGNLTSQTDPKSQTVNYTYDDINRPLTEDYTGGSGTEVFYSYDSCTNGKGRLCIATSTGAVATYAYDPMGRITSETKKINGNIFTTSSYFDRQGNLTDLIYPDNSEARYTYNAGGQVEVVDKRESPSASWESVVSSFDYSPMNQVTNILYGNNTESILTYDPAQLYRLTRKITTKIPPPTGGEGVYGFASMKDYLRAASSTLDKHNDAILNAPFEEQDLRTPRSQTFLLGFTPDGDEMRSTKFYTGDVFYKTDSGSYDYADPTLNDTEGSLVMYKAPYKAFLAKNPSDEPISFHNRDQVLDISFPNAATSSKSSILSQNASDPELANRQVTYQNLLGAGLDVEVTTNTDSLVKQFVIKNKGALDKLTLATSTYEIPFDITSNHDLDVEIDGKLLSKDGPITSSSTAKIIDSAGTVTYLWAPMIDDENPNHTHFRNIAIRYEKTPTGLRLAKLIPADYFSKTTYPVRTDAVLSPYTSAGDGADVFQSYGVPQSFSSVRSQASANIVGGDWVYGGARAYNQDPGGSDDGWGIDRVFLDFDTSGLGANATITSATLYTYARFVQAASEIYLVKSNQASSTLLQDSDYSQLTLNNPAEGALRKKSSDWVTTGYSRWDLATTGIAWISSTSTTKLAMRNSLDILNNQPLSNTYYGIMPWFSEAGAGKVPYLQITYVAASSTDVLQDLTYTYDTAGNITSIVDQSGTNTKKNLYLTYDDLNRLTQASTTGAIYGGDYKETFTYDALGNITNKSDKGNYLYQGNTGSFYANPDAATSVNGIPYTYDNNGNLLGNGSATSTWDYANHISQIASAATTTKYAYDHVGQRVKNQVGSLVTYYPNQYFDVTATTTQDKHIYANGLLLASVRGLGTGTSTYWTHTDYLGSPTLITDASSTLNELSDYYPFGEVRINQKQSSYDESRKYIGQEYDDDTSLSYLNARYLDGRIGRFVSEDPMSWKLPVEILADPQQQNFYSYARNNPITRSDPSGQLSLLQALSNLVRDLTAYVNAISSSYYYVSNNSVSPTSSNGGSAKNTPPQVTTTWDPVTDKRISQLDPRVRQPAANFINKTESELGVQLRVTQGYRSIEEQNKLYAQGRTTPGNIVTYAPGGESYHNYGRAIDVAIVENGQVNWNKPITEDIVNIGTGQGFVWGGSWSTFKDYPHFEMSFGDSVSSLYTSYLNTH